MGQEKSLRERSQENLRPLQQTSEVDFCKAKLIVTNNGFKLKPEKSDACERQVANISKLGTFARKYLEKRLE